MELPNLYKSGDYKPLILLPLILVVLSLYFMRNIPAGLELRGGTLLTIQTNGSFDKASLEDSIKSELGVRDVSIEILEGPLGSKVEIQIEQNERIAKGEKDMKEFYSRVEEVNGLEYDIPRLQSELEVTNITQIEKDEAQRRLTDAQTRLPKAREEMNSLADSVIEDYKFFVGSIDRSNATDTKSLESLLANTSTSAKQKYKEKIIEVISSHMQIKEFSLKDVSPSLSEFFLSKTQEVVIWSFLLTGILVVIIFRALVPSLAVILGTVADILIALGGMGLFGIPLTLPSIAALLMLIGFSLETGILLTTRVVRRKEGTAAGRAYEAMKTGVMMSLVSILGFAVLLAIGVVTQITTYYQIATVGIFGLIGDIVATWCMSAVMILWDAERKGKGGKK